MIFPILYFYKPQSRNMCVPATPFSLCKEKENLVFLFNCKFGGDLFLLDYSLIVKLNFKTKTFKALVLV